MIDFYFWTSPNPYKIAIFLEEAALAYKLFPINIHRGDQHKPEFVALNPNRKVPVIVDHDTGGEPAVVFESGAILLYLADKVGKFIPRAPAARLELTQWLAWHLSSIGPISGQVFHFKYHPLPQRLEYPIWRYSRELARLYSVLDERLTSRSYLLGEDYTILDMANYGWIMYHPYLLGEGGIDKFPNVKRWFGTIDARPAVQRALQVGAALKDKVTFDEEAQRALFGAELRAAPAG